MGSQEIAEAEGVKNAALAVLEVVICGRHAGGAEEGSRGRVVEQAARAQLQLLHDEEEGSGRTGGGEQRCVVDNELKVQQPVESSSSSSSTTTITITAAAEATAAAATPSLPNALSSSARPSSSIPPSSSSPFRPTSSLRSSSSSRPSSATAAGAKGSTSTHAGLAVQFTLHTSHISHVTHHTSLSAPTYSQSPSPTPHHRHSAPTAADTQPGANSVHHRSEVVGLKCRTSHVTCCQPLWNPHPK